MSKIRLYLDEDASDLNLAAALQSRAVDVWTVADAGMLGRSDEDQLALANQNNRALFSFNIRDFYRLHTLWIQQGLSHSGIILAPQQRYGIGELIRGILSLMDSKSAAGMQGQVEFLSNWIS
ncbi:MAG: DUF5615 family PIN-like protein [Cyanobacteriota bacterium]|nr:DUF5615 family PIN-like protein [Cyanobacteriota bacterium]